jgi:hypothetical protein
MDRIFIGDGARQGVTDDRAVPAFVLSKYLLMFY